MSKFLSLDRSNFLALKDITKPPIIVNFFMRKQLKINLKTFTDLIKSLCFFNKYNRSFSRGTLERCYLYNQNESFKCAEAVWENVSHRS